MKNLLLVPLFTICTVAGVLLGLRRSDMSYPESIDAVMHNDHMYWRTDNQWYKSRIIEDDEDDYRIDLQNITKVDIMDADMDEVSVMLDFITRHR